MVNYLNHLQQGPSEKDILNRNKNKIKENKNKEKLKQKEKEFFNRDDIKNLSNNLENNNITKQKKDTILKRLLLKFEKNTKNFNLEESFKKVLLGENLGGIPSSGVLLEKEDGTIITKKEKKEIYNKLIEGLKKEKKDPFKNFHNSLKKNEYNPNDTIPANEIPQFEGTGKENIPIDYKSTQTLNSTTKIEKTGEENIHKNLEKTNNKNIEEKKLNNNINKYLDPPNGKEQNKKTKNTEQEKNNSEKLDNNPLFPSINRLKKQGNISEETLKEIKNQLLENNKINTTKISNKTEGKIVNLFLEKINNLNPKESINNLTKDIKNIPELNELKIEINKDGTFEDEVFNKIGENYIKIPDKNNNLDTKGDLQTAIITTKNEILKEVKTINKDSEIYKQALIDINSNNIKQQVEGIKKLYTLAYSSAGIFGKKTMEKLKKSKKEKLKNEFLKANEKLNTLQKNPKENKEKIKKLNKEIENIIKQAKKIESGEIFKAGKIDKANSNIEKNIKTK